MSKSRLLLLLILVVVCFHCCRGLGPAASPACRPVAARLIVRGIIACLQMNIAKIENTSKKNLMADAVY